MAHETTEMHLSHEHCWHVDSHAMFTMAIWPPMMARICCNCGQREMYREPPPIPEGHGPFYPRRQNYTVNYGNTSYIFTHGSTGTGEAHG